MAGHSHWAKIKRAKGASDAKKGKLFGRLAREISMATKLGGADPGFNPRLRQAIANAKAESMTNDTINRAIKKGSGELGGESYEEMTYEGYGPSGVALLVEATTDNKNRTAAEIRSLFTKNAGNMSAPGSVAWMFQRKGLILIPQKSTTEEQIMNAALEAGAEDVQLGDENFEVTTLPEKLYAVEAELRKANLPVEKSQFTYLSTNPMTVSDEQVAQQVLLLVEALEDHDDVQAVYANSEIADEVLAKLA
ncbi:MAG: YebC/PmpR family DNA-binding transcriptional regulator [Verrucomicrobiae bacterium]|nr:YebC/PmpR family DNA-binding transcriptional regulator [Verrucomicrobiae bacterium]